MSPELASCQWFRFGSLVVSLQSGEETHLPVVPEPVQPFQIKKPKPEEEAFSPVCLGFFRSRPTWSFSPDQADYSHHSLYFKAGEDDWRFHLALKPGKQGPIVWFRYTPSEKSGEIYYENFPEDDLIHPFGRPCGEMIVVTLLSFMGGISIHACGVIREGRVRIFTGTSGAGKSTSAELWNKTPGAEVLSDEVILLYEQEGAVWACGTPWHSSLPLYSNQAGPVEKILFIRHLDENKAVRLSPVQASTRLLARTHLIQWDQRKLVENFDFALRVAQSVACYDFGFLPEASAVEYVECLR